MRIIKAGTEVFQSLFLWKSLFNLFAYDVHDVFFYVSILVFMEVPLQQAIDLYDKFGIVQFQSLFLWKSLFNRRAEGGARAITMFQSLFLWKSLFNRYLIWQYRD